MLYYSINGIRAVWNSQFSKISMIGAFQTSFFSGVQSAPSIQVLAEDLCPCSDQKSKLAA